MAAEQLPQFDEKKTYLMSGKTLNQIIAAIKAANLVSVDGFDIERTAEGVRLKKRES
jgi:hypothetical protein